METTLQSLGMAIATHPLQAAVIVIALYHATRVALRDVRALWLRRHPVIAVASSAAH